MYGASLRSTNGCEWSALLVASYQIWPTIVPTTEVVDFTKSSHSGFLMVNLLKSNQLM